MPADDLLDQFLAEPSGQWEAQLDLADGIESADLRRCELHVGAGQIVLHLSQLAGAATRASL